MTTTTTDTHAKNQAAINEFFSHLLNQTKKDYSLFFWEVLAQLSVNEDGISPEWLGDIARKFRDLHTLINTIEPEPFIPLCKQ